MEYTNLTLDNVDKEHLCCAIGDKKHQCGVDNKKKWLKERIKEGHIFRKANVQGKVFIEYDDIEKAWAPVVGKDYIYIYCLWVAGSFKGNGYAKDLINYCIEDAKKRNKKGICTISSKKKKSFLSEEKFFEKYGFKKVDEILDIELLALDFGQGENVKFSESARKMTIDNQDFTIYYSDECPYTFNCIKEITELSKDKKININFEKVDSLEKAKNVPCVFNNWATFYKGKFVSNTLLNKNSAEKLLENN